MSSILYHTARTSSSAQRCGRHSREPGRPLCGVLRTAPLCGRLCRVPGHHPSIRPSATRRSGKVEKRSSGEADVQSTTSLLHFSASPLFRFSASRTDGWTDGRMDANDFVLRRDFFQAVRTDGLCNANRRDFVPAGSLHLAVG
jgi:hypothetical protein